MPPFYVLSSTYLSLFQATLVPYIPRSGRAMLLVRPALLPPPPPEVPLCAPFVFGFGDCRFKNVAFRLVSYHTVSQALEKVGQGELVAQVAGAEERGRTRPSAGIGGDRVPNRAGQLGGPAEDSG